MVAAVGSFVMPELDVMAQEIVPAELGRGDTLCQGRFASVPTLGGTPHRRSLLWDLGVAGSNPASHPSPD